MGVPQAMSLAPPAMSAVQTTASDVRRRGPGGVELIGGSTGDAASDGNTPSDVRPQVVAQMRRKVVASRVMATHRVVAAFGATAIFFFNRPLAPKVPRAADMAPTETGAVQRILSFRQWREPTSGRDGGVTSDARLKRW